MNVDAHTSCNILTRKDHLHEKHRDQAFGLDVRLSLNYGRIQDRVGIFEKTTRDLLTVVHALHPT